MIYISLYFAQDERKRLKNSIIIQSYIRGYQDRKQQVCGITLNSTSVDGFLWTRSCSWLLNSWIFSLFHIVCHSKGLLWPLCVSVPVRLWPSTYRQCHTQPTCSPASLFLQTKWRQKPNGKNQKYDLHICYHMRANDVLFLLIAFLMWIDEK